MPRKIIKHVGRVQKHARGFAFIIGVDPALPDTYVSPEEAEYLLNRDLVAFTIMRDRKRYRAQTIAVLERGISEVYGRVYSRPSAHLISPGGEVFQMEGPTRCPEGTWALAAITAYPSRREPARIRLVKQLGAALTPEHDNAIAQAMFGLPTEFSQSALDQAHGDLPDECDRVDLTPLPFVTIDGDDARDFDDAVLVTTDSGDRAFSLYVAIADVSHYVRPNTALDQQARHRSTSVYFPGSCIPMLPETLSNDRCSLNPHTDKRVMVAQLAFDREGRQTDARFYPAVISTKARLTYVQLQGFFDSKATPDPTLKTPLRNARNLYRKLFTRRTQRGALDFQLPEVLMSVDSTGNPVEASRVQTLESHRLIEEFMVAANSAVARALRKRSALFRVHERPDLAKLAELNEFVRALGISARMDSFEQKAINGLLRINNPTLHRYILRLQKQARYSFEPLGHFGLALPDYLHFTSPIRRYPDLIVHRALKSLIGIAPHTDNKEQNPLYDLAQETSDKERRAMGAERFVGRRKQCWYIQRHLGREFSGTVSDLSTAGISISLSNLIEGFAPIPYCEFDERRWRVKVGHTFLTLGSPVKVQVAQVDVESGKIELALMP